MSAIIILNYKTYNESTGENAVKLAKICESVAKSSGVKIAVAPQIADLYRVATAVEIPVFSQNLDVVGPGSFTGHVYSKSLCDANAAGTLLNHSEKRMTLADIEKAVRYARKCSLLSVVCTNSIKTSAAASLFDPDFVAVEPPELIGTGIPVSKANPEIVSDTVEAVKNINKDVKVLCGAGISKGEDLKAALELGAEGVLLASGIIKAKDPKAALEDLVSMI
ncbi:MAG: triose-phosphate isomerase [Methanosarcinaceae archaeon]|nr:triose-phosphate isomerase [Methanosarcinaceae archaeon]